LLVLGTILIRAWVTGVDTLGVEAVGLGNGLLTIDIVLIISKQSKPSLKR